jgi:AcrR family transcriptional regulator
MDTKEQILDAAEALFAEHGIEVVPLRRIIAEAGVNQAAIHYHFGSKQALVTAVFARRVAPINRERIALFDEIEREAQSRPPRIEDIVYAMVSPAFRMGQGTPEAARFRVLAGRLLEHREYLSTITKELFGEVMRRYDALVQMALPDLPDVARAWRTHIALGGMIFVLREQDFIHEMTSGLCDVTNVDSTIDQLVQFISAGMKAPVSHQPSEGPGVLAERKTN